MSKTIDGFWKKKKALEQLTSTIDERLRIIQAASAQFYTLRRFATGQPWQWVTITNGPSTVFQGFPVHVVDTNLPVDAATWPRMDEIASLLAQWHRLDEEYRSAWESLSSDEQDQLKAHEPEERRPPATDETN